MKRSQFTFYRSFWEALRELPEDEQAKTVLAICAYALDGEECELRGAPKSIFIMAKPTIDTSARKSANGKKGGSKMKANRNQTESKEEESKPEADAKQTGNEIENEVEVENETENEVEEENECSLPYNPPSAPEKKQTGSKLSLGYLDDDGFEKFWEAYPKKSGDIREACRLYLDAIDAGATLQQMLDAIAWQKGQDSWLDQGGRYIPSPAKWIANKAWLQKPIKAKPPDKSGRKDAPSMDYGSPSRAEFDAMQRLIAKMGTEETAKAVRDETGWSCGKCGASLDDVKPEHCPVCGMRLIYA